MKLRSSIIVFAMLIAAGCATQIPEMKRATVAKIGCQESAMTISNSSVLKAMFFSVVLVPLILYGFPIVLAKFWSLRSVEGDYPQRGRLSFSQIPLPLTS